MKFYFVRLTHITGEVFYKFGVTRSYDVLDRFSQKYPERIGYKDFTIKVMLSYYTDEENALLIEDFFLKKFPPSFSEILSKYNTNTLTDLTEFRTLNYSDVQSVFNDVNKLKGRK